MSANQTKYYFFIICCFATITVAAQNSVSAKIKKSNLYAGIEVGAKGVKMSILQMNKRSAATGSFVTIKDTALNTDFISFTQPTFNATLRGLTALYNVAFLEYAIPVSKIYTVISSGVKSQAEKENKFFRIKNLTDSFNIAVKEPRRLFPVIDAMEEAKLSHIGIVPEARRYNTFLIDIGSGNTKGGYFKNGNTKELKLFVLSWGTKTIANATEKRTEEDKSITNFKKQLNRVIAGDPDREIIYAVNESGAYNMNDNFAFSGGIAWSIANLMYPELIDNSVVPVTFNELVAFNDKLASNFQLYTAENITRNIKDITIDKNGVSTEIKKVLKVFDQKSLMAGTALLIKIMRQFEGTQEKKQFFLVKNGQVGWISAYVNQEVNN
jgi:hypothetical protein